MNRINFKEINWINLTKEVNEFYDGNLTHKELSFALDEYLLKMNYNKVTLEKLKNNNKNIHLDLIKLIFDNNKFKALLNNNSLEKIKNNKELLGDIFELIIKFYKEESLKVEGRSKPCNILVTRIIYALFGCTLTYDDNIKKGIDVLNKKYDVNIFKSPGSRKGYIKSIEAIIKLFEKNNYFESKTNYPLFVELNQLILNIGK